MQTSRYGYTNIASEYLIYPFTSPIKYNLNYTGTYSKYSIIDKLYVNSLIKPTKRLYYGGAEWVATDPIALTFSLTNLAYSFADEILFMTASYPGLSITAPDSTYNRIDAIVVNEDGVIKLKTGSPAPSPKKPALDEDEVLIQYALVKAGIYKIGSSEIVYENNSQWQTNTYQISGSISGSVNFNSTANQYNSTSCIASNTDYRTGLNFTKLTGTINRSEYTSLSMRVRFNGVVDQNRFLSAQIYGTSSIYSGTASSNTINLMAYGLDTETVGTWQHIVVPTIKFGSKVETIKGLKIRLIGGASASNTSWDLDYVLFQSGMDYDEYTDASNATYASGNISTGGSGGGSFSLTVQDYLTGDSFTDINKIIFRGNTVVVHPTGTTAVGVSVTGQSPEITVWIPAPNYVAAFNPTIDTTGSLRYAALSTTQSYTQSVAPGTFGLGTWTPLSDFIANGASVGTTRKTKNGSGSSFIPFVNSGAFSCENNLSTSIVFEVFKEDGTAVRTKTINPLNLATCGQTYATDDSGKTGISITLGAFSNDQDKFKIASLSTSVDCQSIFPNGGRLKCRITYNNGAYTIVKNTEDFFYDNDAAPTSSVVGAVEFDELAATTKYFSGILFYKEGSTFAMTASNIDMLNDSTFPTTKQIDFEPFNLSMSNSAGNLLNGHADGTKSGVGSAITGWNINWDNKGLTFSKSGSINLIMNNADSTLFNSIGSVGYVPGFSPHVSNTLDSNKLSYIKARLFDYGSPDYTITSGTKKTLIDTDAASTPTYLSNPLDGEINRLDFANVFTSGSAAFDSTQLLTNAGNGELQYIFGRVIYPQSDFTTYMPKANWTRLCNYSTCSGVAKTFTVYTKGAVDGSAPNTTTSVAINDYRWHVTSYSKSADLSNSVNNGVFQFESNFLETMLECPLGNIGSSGTGDLAILIGIDSSGTNTTPDRFLYISGDQSLYGGRYDSITNTLNGNSRIGWSKGAVTVAVRKVWLFVGFKHNLTANTGGKSLRMSDILFIPA